MVIKHPSHSQLLELWEHCVKFVEDQKISGGESVYQSDNVIENAYEFIDGVGEITGWYEWPEDEEEGEGGVETDNSDG